MTKFLSRFTYGLFVALFVVVGSELMLLAVAPDPVLLLEFSLPVRLAERSI